MTFLRFSYYKEKKKKKKKISQMTRLSSRTLFDHLYPPKKIRKVLGSCLSVIQMMMVMTMAAARELKRGLWEFPGKCQLFPESFNFYWSTHTQP